MTLNLDTYVDLVMPWRRYLLAPGPVRVRATPTDCPDLSSAVYIALDYDGVVRYVGSVDRTHGGLPERIAEHRRNRFESRYWVSLWVVSLRPETPRETVRRIEGAIGRALTPVDGHRLPVA